ncbi:metalloproteinase inhibitor 4-like [Mytilus trossulus]|uniref:metalloproteinase inhibitor 4-like n=1 Tax=Mytilus trossulus TaxID=6551 RepID=UPI0030055881
MIRNVLQLIIVLSWMTTSIQSCFCGTEHPQVQFCEAHYVLYGKVINETLIPGPRDDYYNNYATWEYTFTVIFRMKGVTERVGQDVVIETAGNDARCGVRFTVGQSYIIMGQNNTDGQKTIYNCNFHEQLGDMSPSQTFYLFSRGSYSYFRNCRRRRCKIGPDSIGCRYGDMNAGYRTASCLAKRALCQRGRRRCLWVNNETC